MSELIIKMTVMIDLLQPVSVIDQRGNPKQVEVDVNLCYCSTQNCNQVSFIFIYILISGICMN